MATYEIDAPDGNTYQIDGPEGASDADIRTQVLAQHPEAGQAPQPAAVNPFNRQLGADVSYGAPLQPPPTAGEQVLGAFQGASRGLEANLPFVDRAVAAAQANLPQGYGGTGRPYAENLPIEKAKSEQFATQNPWTNAVAGTVASAPLFAIPGVGQGTTLGARMATTALPSAVWGTLGGISSAPDLTNNADVSRRAAIGMVTGAATGATAPIFGAGIAAAGRRAGALAGRVGDWWAGGTPGLDEQIANLRAANDAAYQKLDEMGAAYPPESYGALADKNAADLKAEGMDPTVHTGAASVVRRMQNAAAEGTPIPFRQLDMDRRVAYANTQNPLVPRDAQLGGMIRKNIDDFVDKAQPIASEPRPPPTPPNYNPPIGAPGADYVPPDARPSQLPPEAAEPSPAAPTAVPPAPSAEDVASAARLARGLATKQFKLDAIGDAAEQARYRTATSGVGGNIENNWRQEIAKIRDAEPWTPDERAQIDKIALGTGGTNVMRLLSRGSPLGHTLPALAELLHGGPMGGTVAGVGLAAQAGSALARRSAERQLVATILAGGKAAAPPPGPTREALAAALAAGRRLPLAGALAGGQQLQRLENTP